MRSRDWPIGAVLMSMLGLGACGKEETQTLQVDDGFRATLQRQLIEARPGEVIEIPAGRYSLPRGLSLNVSGVTLRGAGMDQTILSFAGQLQGAEGLLVNASDVVIEDLAIEDTPGDGLKVNEGRNVVIRRVRAEWTRGPHEDNGAYGIYPVQVDNLLLEGCVAIGASDAGIYVGQSRNVVVRNNRAERNVAGIEVENTIGADVYGNLVRENTGGILVFNMPDLPQPGHSTRVYQNRIEDNNTPNFGAEGTPVASVPAGSGVVINSNDRVEIFDNFISRNETANVIVSSYFATGYQGTREMAPGYDPWPETIFIHGNRFDGGGSSPDGLKLQALRLAVAGLGGRLPDVLWDGYANPAKLDGEGRLLPEFAICLDNDPAQVLNADLPNDSARLVTGDRQHRCQHAPLPAVDLLPLPG